MIGGPLTARIATDEADGRLLPITVLSTLVDALITAKQGLGSAEAAGLVQRYLVIPDTTTLGVAAEDVAAGIGNSAFDAALFARSAREAGGLDLFIGQLVGEILDRQQLPFPEAANSASDLVTGTWGTRVSRVLERSEPPVPTSWICPRTRRNSVQSASRGRS